MDVRISQSLKYETKRVAEGEEKNVFEKPILEIAALK